MERCAGSNLTGIKLVGDHHVPAGEKSVIINTKDRDYTADTINVESQKRFMGTWVFGLNMWNQILSQFWPGKTKMNYSGRGEWLVFEQINKYFTIILILTSSLIS